MRSSSTIHIAAALALAFVLGACSPSNGTVVSVTIGSGDRSIATGDTVVFSATVDASDGASTGVAWSTGDPAIATVSGDGDVTGLVAGSTDLTATSTADPSKHDAITLTVRTPGALVQGLQFGTVGSEEAVGVATDGDGNAYVVGATNGDLDGANAGGTDGFVRSYDASGNPRWTRQFGTAASDGANAVATDANGHVYVVGNTSGDLEGANAGSIDAFVRSYDALGNPRWTRQFGTGTTDTARGVAVGPSGDVYVVGTTSGDLEGTNAGSIDAFVRAYGPDGTERWTRQFGTPGLDAARSVATDASGDLYVAGSTDSDLEGVNAGGGDAYVRSYDADGTPRWTRQFGSSGNDDSYRIATDADGHVYVIGSTTGDLGGASAGGYDAYVRSYDGAGAVRWTDQFGTSSDDYAYAVATSVNRHVYVAGETDGVLDGVGAGDFDAYLRSYDRDGAPRWTRQFGTPSYEYAIGLAAAPTGDVLALGVTEGNLDAANAGDTDAFLRTFGP